MTTKINNVVVSHNFNTKILFEEFQQKLQKQGISYNIRQLNKILVIQFRYKNSLVRVFPTGKILILISKPLTFKECENLVEEIKLFVNNLIHE